MGKDLTLYRAKKIDTITECDGVYTKTLEYTRSVPIQSWNTVLHDRSHDIGTYRNSIIAHEVFEITETDGINFVDWNKSLKLAKELLASSILSDDFDGVLCGELDQFDLLDLIELCSYVLLDNEYEYVIEAAY